MKTLRIACTYKGRLEEVCYGPEKMAKWYVAVSGVPTALALRDAVPPIVVKVISPNSTSAPSIDPILSASLVYVEEKNRAEEFQAPGEARIPGTDSPFQFSCVEGNAADPDLDDVSEDIEAFLDRVYDLAEKSQSRRAIDVIFLHMNTLLMDGKFHVCDRILSEVDLQKIPPMLMTSFLTITAAARKKLPHRPMFYRNVRRLVEAKRGPASADRLLVGLK